MAVALLLGGAAGGWALRAHQRLPQETRVCTMGVTIGLDAGLRFDENKARNDAVAIGSLSRSVHDDGVRRAAQAIARDLTQDLTQDDADDRVAALLDDLHRACVHWAD